MTVSGHYVIKKVEILNFRCLERSFSRSLYSYRGRSSSRVMSESDRSRRYAQKSKTLAGPSTALMAVALQDHLVKQYSLSFSDPFSKNRLHGQVIAAPPQAHNSRFSCSKCGKGPYHTKQKQQQTVGQTVQINSNMLTLNTNSDGRDTLRPGLVLQQVKQVYAPTSMRTGTASSKEVEHVLDKAPPPLNLAQRMGLVEAPPTLLSSAEWARVKSMSVHRHDSASPCPICHEPFGLAQQVLLSCSHVFHLSCLRSLERFSRSKRCPMCRREDYQKRIIYEGAHYYKNWAAIVIQSLWRGYVVRKWYSSLRQKLPPKHPVLRRKHFERRLERLTESMVQSCDQSSSGADCVLAEADRAMETARQAIRIFDRTIADSEDWCGAYSKAKAHAMSECPVCLVSLHPPRDHGHTHKPRPIAVLSCGHLFHVTCIESLELHNCQEHGEIHLCPLCRTPYLRQIYKV